MGWPPRDTREEVVGTRAVEAQIDDLRQTLVDPSEGG